LLAPLRVGAGCPTFVNASFDDRGLLGEPAGGQVEQRSRAGDHSNGSSESSRGEAAGATENAPQLQAWRSDHYIAQDGGAVHVDSP
jgi:hypothetical protein